MMDWSLFLINAQPPGMAVHDVIDNGVQYALAGERHGFSTAWVLEHHFTQFGVVGSPLFYASFLLGKTTTLKVGTAIQVITLDHPVRLAEQVALLDHLSNGRLVFGFGRGYFLKDFVVFDKDRHKSREIADEWLAISRAIGFAAPRDALHTQWKRAEGARFVKDGVFIPDGAGE